MLKSIQKYLIISVFSLVFISCNSLKIPGEKIDDKAENYQTSHFTKAEKEDLYQAEIIAFDKNLKGILAVKNYGENHKRIALVSKLGNTIFDFEFKENKSEINYIIDDLDRKIIREKLKKYFELLANTAYKINKTYQTESGKILKSKLQGKSVFLYFDEAEKLYKIRQASIFKEKVEIKLEENNKLIFQSKELPIEMIFVR